MSHSKRTALGSGLEAIAPESPEVQYASESQAQLAVGHDLPPSPSVYEKLTATLKVLGGIRLMSTSENPPLRVPSTVETRYLRVYETRKTMHEHTDDAAFTLSTTRSGLKEDDPTSHITACGIAIRDGDEALMNGQIEGKEWQGRWVSHSRRAVHIGRSGATVVRDAVARIQLRVWATTDAEMYSRDGVSSGHNAGEGSEGGNGGGRREHGEQCR